MENPTRNQGHLYPRSPTLLRSQAEARAISRVRREEVGPNTPYAKLKTPSEYPQTRLYPTLSFRSRAGKQEGSDVSKGKGVVLDPWAIRLVEGYPKP